MSQDAGRQQPVGVHLVGSVPLANAADVFSRTSRALPNRLLRIPDGETSNRQEFVIFQRDLFKSMPQVLRQYDAQYNPVATQLPSESELEALCEQLDNHPPQTQYDDHAIDSYTTFSSLRSSGVIPKQTKFQVSLPTPLNVVVLFADGYQTTLEPYYEQALGRALKKLQSTIPHADLAIQWDTAGEFAMLEGASWPHFVPYFSPVKEGIIERLIRLADLVEPSVECGFHLCYGDMGHRHFIEPKDMGLLVEIATAIIKGSKRDITWFHMPVPKNRTDYEYFKPLESFELGNTALYLGVVHFDDLEGTKQRINATSKTGKQFGVATECGMGRTPPEHLDSILEISNKVSAPHW